MYFKGVEFCRIVSACDAGYVGGWWLDGAESMSCLTGSGVSKAGEDHSVAIIDTVI